ncbi:MAG: histidine phosphatase family protein, partial [Lachnospiraceae bacterium]
MRVYLIRHGTTSGNLEKRYVGSTDEPLTADAVAWVKKNRRRYPVPQQTVTSPMKRCVATSALLFPGIPTETKEGLRECSFGEFEYKNYQELTGNEAYQRWIDSGGELPFPGGESRQEFADRSCSALLKSVTEQLKKGRDSVAYVV